VEDKLSEQIRELGDQVHKYQKTYNDMPEGYIENMHFPNLKVPIGASFHLLAKWIKRLDTGDMSYFTSHNGPHDLPHIIPIYASPLSSDDMPVRLLPWWFRSVLTGPHPQFLTMVESTCKFEDWGVAVELVCYHKYATELTTINTKICQLQLDATAIEQDCAISKQWLKASRCTEGLTHLKGLGPKSAHAK
jgi:hypothetical protein